MYRFMSITLTLAALIMSASLAVAAPEVPGPLMLVPPAGMEATKAGVNFPHDRHGAAKVDCVTCHHTWDGQAAVQSCSAPGCHDQAGKKETNAFYSAFHSKNGNSCLACHKTMKKEGRNVPVGCADCHAK